MKQVHAKLAYLIQLVHLTVAKRPADFLRDAHTSGAAEVRSVDFSFDIPYTRTVSSHPLTSSQSLPSSTLVEASKYMTNHTALSDRQSVQGTCDVSYQVEARFLLQGSTVLQTRCPVSFLSLADPQASLGPQIPAQGYKSVARTAILRRPWRRGKGDLSVSVLEPEPVMWRSEAQQACHPINLCAKLLLHQSAKVAFGSIGCFVKARWEAVTKFSVKAEIDNPAVVRSSDSHLLMSKTVVLETQDVNLLFPPWYQVAAEGESQTFSTSFCDVAVDDFGFLEAAGSGDTHSTTMTTFTLVSPQLSMGPPFATTLMAMKYVVDITLSIKDPHGSGRTLSSEFRIPLQLSSSETRSTGLKVESCAPQGFGHHETEVLDPPQYVS